MSYQPSYKSSKQSQAQRQQTMMLVFGILAILMLAIGVLFVWLWATGAPSIASVFASDTPTATASNTPTNTLEPSLTPTITLSPTATLESTIAPTNTAAVPFQVTVQSGDSLQGLALQHGLDETYGWLIIMQYNQLEEAILYVGDTLVIPNPDAELYTPTTIPFLPAGTDIDYLVLPGDTGAIIADKFLSTLEGIEASNATYYEERYGTAFDINFLRVGDVIKVPVRLVTPTFGPSATQDGAVNETPQPTAAGVDAGTATITPTP